MRFSHILALATTCASTLLALPSPSSPQDIPALFPSSEVEITKYVSRTEIKYKALLSEIITTPTEKQNYDTVLKKWDIMEGEYQYAVNLLDAIHLCSPNEEMRKAAGNGLQQIKSMRISALFDTPEAYDVLTTTSYEGMPQELRYYFDQVKERLKKDGFHLSGKTREELRALFTESFSLEKKFVKNISDDTRHILTTHSQLDGLPERIIESLSQTPDGKYILTTDYPTFFPVQKNCSDAQIRKSLNEVFANRGYPHNQKVLDKLVELRGKIAETIGYDSYAEMDLKTEMVRTPQNAYSFLFDLSKKVSPKATQEASTLRQLLPAGVKLTEDGKIQEWDLSYTIEHAQKEVFNLSNEEIAEYFPLQSTLAGLMGIYEEFFNIQIEECPITGMWSDEVRVLKISEKGNNFVHGYVLLDLHPRPNKYTHACMVPLLPSYDTEEHSYPGTTLLICNFARNSKEIPALLSHGDVTTFFHEFGHALHHLFGRTSLTSATLDAVSADFVELPSQLLEEWMWDKEMLKRVSRHYKTGLPLPDRLIGKMIDARKFTSGLLIERQCALSLVSLSLFEGKKKVDPNHLFSSIFEQYYPHIALDPNGHKIMSFSHLQGYGSRYYGYLWSRVIATDIFSSIKTGGLLNPVIGTRYREYVLKPAATRDPNVMVREFLEREPSNDPFLKNLGL